MESLSLFRHPQVLMLMVLPAALLMWIWKRKGRAVVLPFDHAEPRSASWTRFFLHLAESAPAILIGIVVLLLAGPQSWDEPRDKRVLTNIEFCVDVSGSMSAKFGDGDRYEAAMEAINEFLDYRKGDAFGLTFFGNNVLHWVPLTTDISAFRCAPPFMRPGRLPPWFGGTEIGKALLACRKMLTEREEGDRMILLVTDGYSADLAGGRDEEIARTLRGDRIVVYSVHIAEGEVPDPDRAHHEPHRWRGLQAGRPGRPRARLPAHRPDAARARREDARRGRRRLRTPGASRAWGSSPRRSWPPSA